MTLKDAAKKVALGAGGVGAAGLASADSIVQWTSLATSTTAEVTAAVGAGVGVLALFLGVAGGVRMFRKFIGG